MNWVVFTLRKPGFHRWEDAPKKWGYLSNWHRHEFHIQCELEVTDNRAIEIINAKENLSHWLESKFGIYRIASKKRDLLGLHSESLDHLVLNQNDLDGSCEALAEYIALYLMDTYKTVVKVTVLEDGENGAKIEVEAS